MASTSIKRPRDEESDYEPLDTGTSMMATYGGQTSHPYSNSGLDEEIPDIPMEDAPPLKRLSTVTSRNLSTLGSKEENVDTDDTTALEAELFTVSGRAPSRIGSLEATLQSSSLGTATVDTTKYRATYGYGAREMAVDYRFPNRSDESSDSTTLVGNSPKLGTISRFSKAGNTSTESHLLNQNTFEQRELELGVASRIKSAVLSGV
jgi:hypothetical protein